MFFHARHVCPGRKVFSMPFSIVRVICDSKSIFIPRNGYCAIETHVYDATVNFTIEIQVANAEA